MVRRRSANDFSAKTRNTLAKRANQVCSNPNCQLPTSGPHSDVQKAVDIGEAAHIRGARPGAKRYDRNMTPAERSSIVNGIWLCRKCAKLIDSDEIKYTVGLLHQWKAQHEVEIDRQVGSAPFHNQVKPVISEQLEIKESMIEQAMRKPLQRITNEDNQKQLDAAFISGLLISSTTQNIDPKRISNFRILQDEDGKQVIRWDET